MMSEGFNGGREIRDTHYFYFQSPSFSLSDSISPGGGGGTIKDTLMIFFVFQETFSV